MDDTQNNSNGQALSNDEREVFIPDFTQFCNDVKSIYGDGNMRKAYTEVCRHIQKFTTDDNVTPVTYDLIITKWDLSIKLWNKEYGEKKEQYITEAARNKRKNIYDFVSEFLYNDEYTLDKGSKKRDEYLFAKWLSIPEYFTLHTKIKRKINERREKILEDGK